MIELQREYAITQVRLLLSNSPPLSSPDPQVQRMVRGFVARRRYLAILEALALQEKRVLEKQQSLPLERAMTPVSSEAPPTPPLVVQINGTEVEISFAPDTDTLPTTGYCDCLVTTTDLISQQSASVLLPSLAVSRYWNLFKALPLEFEEAVVQIHRLSVTELDQVDLIGSNDPYLTLTMGGGWKVRTEAVSEGGADVEWKIAAGQRGSYQFPVTALGLLDRQKPLEVQVYDANNFRSDVLIGEAKLDLSPLASLTSYGEVVSLTREIRKRGKVRGYVTVTCALQHVGSSDGSEESGDEGIAKSTIHSIAQLLLQEPLKREFTSYLARSHLELFLSRASGVMVLRAVG
jgi:hypothetical protein